QQGGVGAERHLVSCASQCRDPGGHAERGRVRLSARGRGDRRRDLRAARHRPAGPRCHQPARLRAGAGNGAVHRPQLPDRKPHRRPDLRGPRSPHPARQQVMQGTLRAIAGHPSGRIGAVIILAYVVAALLATLGLTPHDPLTQFRIDRLTGPSPTYLMGTDLLGRDTFSRLMLGIGQSFTIAFSAVALATLAGTIIGLFAAWWGHLLDGV